MKQRTAFALALLCVATVGASADDTALRGEDAAAARVIARRTLLVCQTVLDRHIDPPTRQEMVLQALRAGYRGARVTAPAGLARQISPLSDPRDLERLVAESVQLLRAGGTHSDEQLAGLLIGGALRPVQGLARFSTAGDLDVEQQLRDNRYVGIGIALGKQGEYPSMLQVIPYGPADRAGAKSGDLMIRIDELDAAELELPEIVQMLRGQEGKPVTIVVRRPDGSDEQSLNIIRGHVPFATVVGQQRDADGHWQYGLEATGRIAYVKLEAIRGNAVSELQRAAREIRAAGFRALVLDLRGAADGDVRHAAMFADALLGEAKIGAILDAGGRREFSSKPDQLFPSIEMVALIDAKTQGQAVWIAAALQDNRRATLLGTPSGGAGFVRERVPLPDGSGAIELPTGTYWRSSGEPLPEQIPGLRLRERQFHVNPSSPTASVPGGVTPDLRVESPAALQAAIQLLSDRLEEGTEPVE